ncbi:MAG: response regulator [Armatimonadetes bacterium]|nr:response regulator [Armatimonadota bacterium]
MKILLVEDSIISRNHGAKILEVLGHSVFPARTGEQAIEQFCSQKPDVVITDLDLPYMDGVDVIRKIRKQDKFAKILVSSCASDKSLLSGALEAGACEVLSKPMQPDQVSKALSRLNGRSAI